MSYHHQRNIMAIPAQGYSVNNELINQSLEYHGVSLMQHIREQQGEEMLFIPAEIKQRFTDQSMEPANKLSAEDQR